MKNSFWLGLLLGSVFPMLALLADRYTDWTSGLAPEKEALPYVVAAAANLVLVRLCYKREAPSERTAKGVVLVTFAVAICVFRF